MGNKDKEEEFLTEEDYKAFICTLKDMVNPEIDEDHYVNMYNLERKAEAEGKLVYIEDLAYQRDLRRGR